MKSLFKNIVLIAGIGLMPAKPILAGKEWDRIVKFFIKKVRHYERDQKQIADVGMFLKSLITYIKENATFDQFMNQQKMDEKSAQTFLEQLINMVATKFPKELRLDVGKLKNVIVAEWWDASTSSNAVQGREGIEKRIHAFYETLLSNANSRDKTLEGLANKNKLKKNMLKIKIQNLWISSNTKLLVVVLGVFGTAYLLARYQDKVTKPALDWVWKNTIDRLQHNYKNVVWMITNTIVLIPVGIVGGIIFWSN